MAKHVLKPWKEICPLRDEIKNKTLTMADFAVDLHRVIFEPGGGKYYTDPAAFFATSYATPNLRRFCRDVLRLLAKEDGGEPIINVAQTFGGGNPHRDGLDVLVVALERLRALVGDDQGHGDAIQDDDVQQVPSTMLIQERLRLLLLQAALIAFDQLELMRRLGITIPRSSAQFHSPLCQFTGREVKTALQVLQPRHGFRPNRRAGRLQETGFRQHPGMGVGALDLLERGLQQAPGFPHQRGRRTHERQQMVGSARSEFAAALPAQPQEPTFHETRLGIARAQRPLARLADIDRCEIRPLGGRIEEETAAPRIEGEPPNCLVAKSVE